MCLAFGLMIYLLHPLHSPTPTPDSSGVREGELVNWYLKEVADDIENVEELTEKKLLVEKVIERLVQHVSRS